MDQNRKRLSQWIRRRLMIVGVDCTGLVLKHTTANTSRRTGGTTIHQFEPPESLDDTAIAKFVEDVMTIIELDADGLTGVQSYSLLAYDGDKAVGRLTVRIESDGMEDESDLSEPATKQGSLHQQMRHNEALMKGLITSQTQSTYALTRMVEYLSEQNSALMKGHLEQVMAMEQLLTMKHERDEMSRMTDAKITAINGGIDTVKMLGPILARRLAKRKDRKSLPAPADPIMQIIGQLATTLDNDQITQIAGTLNESQRLGFLELIAAAKEGGQAQQH